MRYRRTLLCLVLAVLVFLCLQFSTPAKADTLSLVSDGKAFIPISMASAGNVLYVYTSEYALFSYDMATGEVRRLQANLPEQLFLVENGGEVLYISIIDGCLYRLDTSEGRTEPEKIVQLDFQGLLELEDLLRKGIYGGALFPFLRAVLQGDTLYLMMSTEGMPQSVVAFDLITGKRTATALKDIFDFAAYKKDSLLVIDYTVSDGKSSIDIYNTQSGELREWKLPPTLDCDNGLAYDEKSDTVYVLGGGVIYGSKDSGPFRESGYSSINQYAQVTNVAIGEGKYFALVPGEAVYCFPLDSAKSATPLHLVDGWWDEEALKAFRDAHPEIPLVFESFSNADKEQLHKKMLTHDTYFDVYVADAGTKLYDAMLDKGYVQSLSGSEVLGAASRRMYPYFASKLSKDGELMAFPLRIFGYVMSYYQELFAKNGWTSPGTMMEFLDFCAEQAEAGDHVVMYSNEKLSKAVLTYLISAYTARMQKETGTVDFDTPLFRKLMEKWEACAPVIDRGSQNSWDWINGEPLFGMTAAVLRSKYDQLPFSHQPLRMSLEEGQTPVIPAYMDVAMINPMSRNIPAAMQFLEFYAQHIGRELSLILYPDDNEPVIDPFAEQRLPIVERNIEETEKALAQAKDEDKKHLESLLVSQKASLNSIKENSLWSYGAKTIATYRSLAGDLAFVPREMTHTSSHPQITDLIDRFAQRKISGTEFVQEMIRIQRAVEMEE